MEQYHETLEYILGNGNEVSDRTGTGTLSVFGRQMTFDLKEGFPLLASKFTPFRLVANELLWFIMGNPDISYLHEYNNHIWDEFVKKDGTFGPIYGQQWRSWQNVRITQHGVDAPSPEWSGYIDQIANVIERLKKDPHGRRHIVSAWNVADVESGEMALPPCHVMFQFYARPLSDEERCDWFDRHDSLAYHEFSQSDEEFPEFVPRYALSCQLYQRSADMFLGVPFNIASYALLTHMVADQVNMIPDKFIWTGGDCHIYLNHLEQVNTLLSRNPNKHALPRLEIVGEHASIDDYTMDSFKLIGYEYDPAIKAEVSV